jgi:hypothetical protein
MQRMLSYLRGAWPAPFFLAAAKIEDHSLVKFIAVPRIEERDGLTRSVQLVRGQWWRSFLLLALALLALLACLGAGAVCAYLWPFAASGEFAGMTAAAVAGPLVVNAIGFPLLSALVIARLGGMRAPDHSAGTNNETHTVAA